MKVTELIYNAKTGEQEVVERELTQEEIVKAEIEAKQRERQEQIATLRRQLCDTDYKAIKYAEGELTEEAYAETKAQRQQWRNEINELEI